MKDFVKMTLATLAGLIIFCLASMFIGIGAIGAIAALGEKQPVMPREAVLDINMSEFVLAEQTTEANPLEMITAGSQLPENLGIWDAVNAINAAALDPAIKFIYLRPDGLSGQFAHIEEFRKALTAFRSVGNKAIVAYTESPGNGSYYLASAADKIYMTPHNGALNSFCGLSSQLIFLKDILDRLGINMQLIRHGKYKSAGEMFVRSSSSKENLEQNEAMVSSLWESISSEIAESRKITVEDLNSMLDNLKLNLPEDFVTNGLVDELLTREQRHQKLADLFVTDSFENVKSISLSDYAKLNKTQNLKAKNKIAVIYANGDIVDGKEKQNVAGDRFAKIIENVRKDTTIKAVVLRVNSPGGSVLASEKIKAELDLLRERVPVIASYGGYAASGGYWISANSDYIFSNATTLTGSIGVFSMIPDFSKAVNNKLHINVTSVNSNKHADMLSGMRALNPQEVAYMQASVESIYNQFTEIVSNGRDMTVKEVDDIAQGRVWTGAEALNIGLVDQIGTLEDAMRYAAASVEGAASINDIQIVEYPKPQNAMEALLEDLLGTKTSIFKNTVLENVENAFRSISSTETGKAYARIPYEIILQ